MYVKHLATQYALSHWMTAPEMTAQEQEPRTREHPLWPPPPSRAETLKADIKPVGMFHEYVQDSC